MKIALYAKDWDHEEWARRIADALPEAKLRRYDALGDPADIDYAFVWKPEAGFLASLPNLKAICSLGAGVDFLLEDPDLPDVPLVRVIDPDLTARMSEYVLLQCLLHHRKTLTYLRAQSGKKWLPQVDSAASELCVGILGLGNLGLDAARKLQMMGYDVAGWSRSEKCVDGLKSFHGADGLDALLARTDILVSLLPLTPQTEGILDLALFRKLARNGPLGGAVLVNAGRGKLQKEADILTALKEGTLVGASLDVFEQEPLSPESPLWSHPDVIITPHNAASSSPKAVTAHLARQIRRMEAGLPMESMVDRRRGY